MGTATETALAMTAPRSLIPIWRRGDLPVATERWPKFSSKALRDVSGDDYDPALDELVEYARGKPWVWPTRRTCFLTDIHADADALFTSLVASGGVVRTGPGDDDFELTAIGRETCYVFGGDCMDKGPSNLRLLRVLGRLVKRGAFVRILAGNHDVRALVGLTYIGRKEPHLAHLFVRMGKKAVPLFKEVFDDYLAGTTATSRRYSEAKLSEILFPDKNWYRDFPEFAKHIMSAPRIAKELNRIREKTHEMLTEAEGEGLSLNDVYRCCLKLKELFVQPNGEFHWYFRDMKLAHREGSFLFAHAGVDDTVAAVLRKDGVEGLNRWFSELYETDLFELYHGPVGNVFRTKYRDIDRPFTADGLRDAHRAGIYAIVHGHRNITRGQRMVFREGMLNIECDASVNENTRRHEGLDGQGGACTLFLPTGQIHAISTDYPYIKVFDAATCLPMVSFVD
jgi:hypothetical protein